MKSETIGDGIAPLGGPAADPTPEEIEFWATVPGIHAVCSQPPPDNAPWPTPEFFIFLLSELERTHGLANEAWFYVAHWPVAAHITAALPHLRKAATLRRIAFSLTSPTIN